ncbi:collagen-like protein [Luminiphilus sp.]|nr:collagen-like protein [Luminiphilus sp.]
MRLSLLLAFLFTSTVALAADRQINQISVEQSDSQTIIRLFGSDLIRSPKDRVFFAAEASSYSVEPMMMYGDSEYVEVALGMPVMAGQYRISIGPNENTSTLESLVVIGAVGPQGPAGRDGADGKDGVDGMDGSDGRDGLDGRNGIDGLPGPDGANGLPGEDGKSGQDGSSCSANQNGSSVVMSCSDGTSAILASSGTVVVAPEVVTEPSDINTINTGDITVVDDNDILLGVISASFGANFGNIIEIAPNVDGKDLVSLSNTSSGEIFIGAYFVGNYSTLFFTEADCRGAALVLNGYQDGVMFTGDYRDPTRHYFLSGNVRLDGTVLSKSTYSAQRYFGGNVISEASPCTNQDNALSEPWLAEKFSLADELLNAVYPVALEQLP